MATPVIAKVAPFACRLTETAYRLYRSRGGGGSRGLRLREEPVCVGVRLREIDPPHREARREPRPYASQGSLRR